MKSLLILYRLQKRVKIQLMMQTKPDQKPYKSKQIEMEVYL